MNHRFRMIVALSTSLWSFSAYGISQSALQQQLDQYNFFTGSPATFATVCEAANCVSGVSGFENFSMQKRVTSESLYSIGSNSKFITAILTLILVDRGFIRLEDELTDYFPEYQKWSGVTVRHLLQHASGVPPYLFSKEGIYRTMLSVFNWRSRIWTPQDIIKLVQDKPLIYEPGSKIEYNNTNYVLLGMIIEKATATTLDEMLKREIFRPLGMNNTFLRLTSQEKARRVTGYMPLQVPIPSWLLNALTYKVKKVGDYIDTTNIFDESLTWASGGMVSTSADLAKLVHGLFHGKLLSPQALAEMMDFKQGSVLGFPLLYGLGLMRSPSVHGDLYGHGGLTPGYQSISNYLPEKDLTITLAQNLGPSQAYSVFFDLLDGVVRGVVPKSFVPADEVLPQRASAHSVHFRVYGQVTNDLSPKSFFPRAFGYANLKSSRAYTSYQAFETSRVDKSNRSYLILKALDGGNLFDLNNREEPKRQFIEIILDRQYIKRMASNQLRGKDAENAVILAYRGVKETLKDGSEKTCVLEMIDRTLPLALQIEGQQQEFSPGSNVKFLANIPLHKGSLEELPQEFIPEDVTMCP